MKPSYALAVSLIALSMVCHAQVQVPVDNDANEAWKLSQVQHPQPTAPSHPAASHTATGELRGGGGSAPCACWIEPDSSYTLALDPSDDGSSSIITLPFQFSFYGDLYNTCYVNNNGNVSFVYPYGDFSASGFPNATFKIVAPFWADVDTHFGQGQVFYKLTPNALYVNWVSVGYFSHGVAMPASNSLYDSFQLIISDGTDPMIAGGNNVSLCYGDMQWTTGTASGGTDGFGGTPATVGANHGNGIDYLQLGRFDHEGTDWDGPFDNNDGVAWLSQRHFAFSTANADIPPIYTNIGCDTLEVEAGSSLEYPMMMIAGGLGQVITGSSFCPSITAYTETTNTSGDVAQILSTISPTEDEVGMHTINYTAQNDATIPLVSTYTVFVKVLPNSTSGISSISSSQALVMQPNPANDKVALSWPAELRPTLVQVIAMDGSIVLSRTPQTGSTRMQLDVSDLSAGVYTVRVAGPAQISTIRLVRSAGQ